MEYLFENPVIFYGFMAALFVVFVGLICEIVHRGNRIVNMESVHDAAVGQLQSSLAEFKAENFQLKTEKEKVESENSIFCDHHATLNSSIEERDKQISSLSSENENLLVQIDSWKKVDEARTKALEERPVIDVHVRPSRRKRYRLELSSRETGKVVAISVGAGYGDKPQAEESAHAFDNSRFEVHS